MQIKLYAESGQKMFSITEAVHDFSLAQVIYYNHSISLYCTMIILLTLDLHFVVSKRIYKNPEFRQ